MDSRSSFSRLPDELFGIITTHADPVSIINLDLTSRRYHKFFHQNAFAELRLEAARKVVNQFFTLVVFALLKVPGKDKGSEPVPLLENLLKLYPELLTYRLTVKEHVGRKLMNRTAYQIVLAYAADNIYPLMQEHFLRLPNGQEEMKKQSNEQFPDGIVKAYPKYDIEQAHAALHQAKELIQMDTSIRFNNDKNFQLLEGMSENTRKAIDEFFILIKSNDEYTIGLVNDMQIYHKAVDIYYDEEKHKKFTDSPQRDAYCVFILGGLQALFTPNILQVLLQGPNWVIDEKAPLEYVTKTQFRRCDVSPFDSRSQFQLGKHFFLDYYGGAVCTTDYWVRNVWKKFVDQKQLDLSNNLFPDPNPEMSVLKREVSLHHP